MELYGQACETLVPVGSPEVAELTKLLENIFRSVNIALVNELAMLCDRMDIDVWDVIDAAATKPFGYMPFRPGPGLGGHCIPIDPFYLTWKAREFDLHTEFIELAGKVNSQMPIFCVTKVGRALNSRRKALNGSRVLVMGVSYKADVNDTRESPSLRIIELLRAEGAVVDYHDPHVPELAEARAWPPSPLDAESLAGVRRRGGRDGPHAAWTGRWSPASRSWSWTSATSSPRPTARSGGSVSHRARGVDRRGRA